VIDADGLNALSQNSGALPRDGDFVLTPHPKELSRLLGTTTNEIQEDRISAAQDAANKFNCTVVLKGNRTIIANQHQQVFVNPTGNAGMATAGAGDVLSGIIGGFLAQGMHPFEAATAGVYIHGAAGDMAAYELGNAGIIAGDIMSLIPLAISKLHSGEYKGSALELQLFRR
jgi:NAD(P)H-hydrate epimerase